LIKANHSASFGRLQPAFRPPSRRFGGEQRGKIERKSAAGSDSKIEDSLRRQAKIFFTLGGSDVIQRLPLKYFSLLLCPF
jgi:hypothetical protein